MKKIIAMFLCAVLFFTAGSFVGVVSASTETVTYTNYDIIKELAYAYDRQGGQILYDQYYARRSIYSSPEDATAQRTIYLDCSSFVNSCYLEAFGVNVLPYEISPNGKSPATSSYNTYAKDNKDNPDAVDVVGYWEPQTYTTDEERKAVVEDIYGKLQIGDVLNYRHGKTSGSKGHVYIYMGNSTFIHCAGAGSYVLNESNPALSYDANASEVTSKGTIETISASNIFENTEHKRYIFKKTTSDTVWSFGIIRPLARGLTPTNETLNRMKIAGLSMEKTASVCENATVDTDDILTYTVCLENTNSNALEGVTISDILPEGTEFVSGDTGVSINGTSITWQGNVPAKKTVTVNYSVKITADVPGTLIVSDDTYVSGVKLGIITHSVSGYSETQRALLGDTAIKYVKQSKEFDSSLAMAKQIYKDTFSVDIFEYTTPGEVLDQLIDKDNRTRHTSTELSKMIAPNLYGGQDIMYGWLYLESENDKTRLPKEEHLAVGDIIVADWSAGSNVYVYAGEKTLVTTEDGVTKALTIGENIYTSGENILISLLGYKRYAVLRPAMSNIPVSVDVESIEVTSPPAKTIYGSGDTFDSTGMVVQAKLSDGTTREIDNFKVAPTILTYPQDVVTVSFGDVTTNIDVQVNKVVKSVSEASKLSENAEVTVEGIVVGVAHEGYNNDSELIIKDVSNDTLMAVRNIPYGSFPDFGYNKGDRIVFDATVKKDASPKSSYKTKLYLNFLSSNGTIDKTIISKNNEITYKLDNVTEINSWDVMKGNFQTSLKPYTYFKFTADSYMYIYSGGSDPIKNYRFHKNGDATTVSAIRTDGERCITVRNDAMTKNLGANWTKLFFDEASSTIPGTNIEKEFYAVYIGGNGSYYQIVILDESWVYDSEFYISGLSNDKKKVEINIPKAGSYTLIFADYENELLNKVRLATLKVAENEKGIHYVEVTPDIVLGAEDKIMLWDSATGMLPKCEALLID